LFGGHDGSGNRRHANDLPTFGWRRSAGGAGRRHGCWPRASPWPNAIEVIRVRFEDTPKPESSRGPTSGGLQSDCCDRVGYHPRVKLVALYLVAACQTSPAAVPHSSSQSSARSSDVACAAALPLLAKQHTPNATRLYLAPVSVEHDTVHVGPPVLATSKRGFVNQPSLLPDGSGLYFTWRPEGSQADIWFRDLRTGAEHPVTCTSVEEYAASPTRDGLIVVRVEADLSRRLVRLDLEGHERQVVFPSMTTVGAHAWVDDNTAVLFEPGPDATTPSSLVLADLRSGKLETVARDVGAALAAIPGARAVSYIDNQDEHQPKLMRLDVDTHATMLLLALPEGADNVAWLPDGSVVRGSGTRILRASMASPAWQEVADLAGTIEGTIMRLVIRDNHLAIVVHIE
jgi:hypothetical protein